jgi:hypothetical protein
MKGVVDRGFRFSRLVVPGPDCIVEERRWIHGAEFVSRVNYSQLGRIRVSLGLPRASHFDVDFGVLGNQPDPFHPAVGLARR